MVFTRFLAGYFIIPITSPRQSTPLSFLLELLFPNFHIKQCRDGSSNNLLPWAITKSKIRGSYKGRRPYWYTWLSSKVHQPIDNHINCRSSWFPITVVLREEKN